MKNQMNPVRQQEFRNHLRALNLSGLQASELLELAPNTVYGYLRGEHRVPKTVLLACRWIRAERALINARGTISEILEF